VAREGLAQRPRAAAVGQHVRARELRGPARRNQLADAVERVDGAVVGERHPAVHKGMRVGRDDGKSRRGPSQVHDAGVGRRGRRQRGEAIVIGVPAYQKPEDVTLGRVMALPFLEQRDDWISTT